MPRHRRAQSAPPPAPAIGAGLPLQGRHGGKLAALISITLLVAAAVIAYLQRSAPTPAPVIFACGGSLVAFYWAALRQLGPRWVVALGVQTALTAVLAWTLAATVQLQRPAEIVPAQSSAVLSAASVSGWNALRHLAGMDKADPPAPATTTRPPR